MGSILIRNIPEDAHQRLRDRAKRDGTSVEALLRDAAIGLAKRPTPPDNGESLIDAADRRREELGIAALPEGWSDTFDDPAWGNALFGLDGKGDAGPAPDSAP